MNIPHDFGFGVICGAFVVLIGIWIGVIVGNHFR